MSLLNRYRILIFLSLYYAGYVALIQIAPFKERGDGLRALALILSGWAMIAYWRPFTKTIFAYGPEDERHPYAVLMFLLAAAINKNTAIGLVWRLSGQPYYIINNWMFDWWLVDIIAALFVAVTVPNLFGKGVPPSDRIRIGSLWLIMFSMASYLVLAQPDLRPFAESIRPFIDMKHVYPDPD